MIVGWGRTGTYRRTGFYSRSLGASCFFGGGGGGGRTLVGGDVMVGFRVLCLWGGGGERFFK